LQIRSADDNPILFIYGINKQAQILVKLPRNM